MNPKASLVIGIICISFSPIFVKLAVASPITSGFYRIFVAWVVLAPYCLIKSNLKIARKDLFIALLGGVIGVVQGIDAGAAVHGVVAKAALDEIVAVVAGNR